MLTSPGVFGSSGKHNKTAADESQPSGVIRDIIFNILQDIAKRQFPFQHLFALPSTLILPHGLNQRKTPNMAFFLYIYGMKQND